MIERIGTYDNLPPEKAYNFPGNSKWDKLKVMKNSDVTQLCVF